MISQSQDAKILPNPPSLLPLSRRRPSASTAHSHSCTHSLIPEHSGALGDPEKMGSVPAFLKSQSSGCSAHKNEAGQLVGPG